MKKLNKLELKKLKEYVYPDGMYKNTRSNSQTIKKHFPEIYNNIKDNYQINLYMLLNNIKEIPVCKNTKCNNIVKLKNIGAGFRQFCCNKCISEFQKTDINFKNKISNSKKNNSILKLNNKFKNLKIEHYKNNKNYYLINNYCTHSPFTIYRATFNKLYKNNKNLCIECNKELIKNFNPTKEKIIEFQNKFQDFFNIHKLAFDKKWFQLYYPKEYKIIITWSKHINTISLSEQIYLFRKKLVNRPICKICNKRELIFKSSFSGYSKTCTSKACYMNSSTLEIEVYNFLLSLNSTTKSKFFINRREYDIIVQDKNLLVEFNGLYWHGDLIKDDKKYHYNKYLLAKEYNYDLFNIWEDDWHYKNDIIKSILTYKVGRQPININGRECIIKEFKDTKQFLNENHLQGWCQSSINLGLYYEDELVSLMTFGARKISSKNQYELLRFCNKKYTNVRGGASKLFKYFTKHYNSDIISYASCDYSNGNLYEVLGFKKIGHTGINYWWCDNDIKYSRNKFMKHKLVEKGFDKNKTEDKIMREREFYKIWGSGNLKYEFKM